MVISSRVVNGQRCDTDTSESQAEAIPGPGHVRVSVISGPISVVHGTSLKVSPKRVDEPMSLTLPESIHENAGIAGCGTNDEATDRVTHCSA